MSAAELLAKRKKVLAKGAIGINIASKKEESVGKRGYWRQNC